MILLKAGYISIESYVGIEEISVRYNPDQGYTNVIDLIVIGSGRDAILNPNRIMILSIPD